MIFPRPKAFDVKARRYAEHVEKPDIGEAPSMTSAPKPLVVDRSTDAFFTPPDAAADLIATAGPGRWQRWLEPSAGTGALVAALLEYEPELKEIVAVERSLVLASTLKDRFPELDVRTGDFLEITPDEIGLFDGIVMNPPFHRGAAQRHVEHALKFLKPGGALTAIVPSTFKGGTTVQELPAGTFSNTAVSTKIIIW